MLNETREFEVLGQFAMWPTKSITQVSEETGIYSQKSMKAAL